MNMLRKATAGKAPLAYQPINQLQLLIAIALDY